MAARANGGPQPANREPPPAVYGGEHKGRLFEGTVGKPIVSFEISTSSYGKLSLRAKHEGSTAFGPWRGSIINTRNIEKYDVRPGDYIVQLKVWVDKGSVRGIQFFTSENDCSTAFGRLSDECYTIKGEGDNKVLVGIRGKCGWYLDGVGCYWAAQTTMERRVTIINISKRDVFCNGAPELDAKHTIKIKYGIRNGATLSSEDKNQIYKKLMEHHEGHAFLLEEEEVGEEGVGEELSFNLNKPFKVTQMTAFVKVDDAFYHVLGSIATSPHTDDAATTD